MKGFEKNDKIILINHKHEGRKGEVTRVIGGYIEIRFYSALPIHIKEGAKDFVMAIPSACVEKV